MSSTKVGIAIYAQQGSYNRPRDPHWALVLHPTSFSAHDVRVYHIRGRNGVWTLGHEVRDLPGMGNLVGVLHIADIPPSPPKPLEPLDDCDFAATPSSPSDEEEVAPKSDLNREEKRLPSFGLDDLDMFIKKFPATKNGDDPSALFMWTCESYVIRALAHLSREGALELPCKPEEMYDHTRRRIAVLKSSPHNGTQIRVIPFAE